MLSEWNSFVCRGLTVLGTLTPHLHQWTDHPHGKLIRKHWPKRHARPDGLNRNLDRTRIPKAAEYTFFASAHETFSRINYMLGHKFKKIEILSSIFSDHSSMRLETNYKKKQQKNMWRPNNMSLNNQWITEGITEEIKEEILKKYMETNEMKNAVI